MLGGGRSNPTDDNYFWWLVESHLCGWGLSNPYCCNQIHLNFFALRGSGDTKTQSEAVGEIKLCLCTHVHLCMHVHSDYGGI